MDKSGIRTVIHLALPASVEAYLQESGRAGRDRKSCRAVLLYHPEDRHREDKNPRPDLRERYEKLVAFAEDSSRCRRESLLAILEAEPEDCNSCDVCKDEVILKDPAENFLIGIVGLYKKRFTQIMLADFLCGRFSYEIRQGRYFRSPGFGKMKEWDPDDVSDAIKGLVSSGKVCIINKGSWKGKLSGPRRDPDKLNIRELLRF